ncbi:protease inhibitor I42 family protein [Aequorivita capsosiphonis]|uniref:protease inhibitor I42 family protein n=1 Tax=Aequorivita capsosiphonis TaxID=487317 RepID=UPI0003F85955|nr:protease inhibitor I42 family protein [Aequorivita capsosiphonis]
MSKIRKYLVLISFLVFTGCAGPYTYKDSGSSVELSVNDTFEIVLKGESESKYSWQLVKPNSFVELVSAALQKTKGNEIEYTFKFRASGQGKETLSLIYSDGMEVENTFELLVVIGTLGPIL